jgi:hypothetical protein
MKRKLLTLLLAVIVCASNSYAQKHFSASIEKGKVVGNTTLIKSLSKAVILSADFETGAIPAGWSQIDGDCGWMYGTNGSSSYFPIPAHTTYAWVNDDACDGNMADVWLITSSFDLTTYAAPKLSFATFNYSDICTVKISTDGGTNWTDLAVLGDNNSAWTTLEFSLAAYTTYADVKLAFHYNDQGFWGYGWALDDVMVTEPEPHDLGVTEVLPTGHLSPGVAVAPSVTVFNYGGSDESTWSVQLTNGVDYDETVDMTATITSGGEYIVDFPEWIAEVGTYTFTATVTVTDDANSENDVATSDVDVSEVLIPLDEVTATDMGTSASVEWGFTPSYEIKYCDDVAENATAWYNPGFANALKLTPLGYPCTILSGSVNIYDGTWPAGTILSPMRLSIYDDDGAGGLPGTELGYVELTPTGYNWVDVDFSAQGITLTDGDFYVVHTQLGSYPNVPPTGIDETNINYLSYAYDPAAGWAAAGYNDFMFRAIVQGPSGKEYLNFNGAKSATGFDVFFLAEADQGTPANWVEVATGLAPDVFQLSDETNWPPSVDGTYMYAVIGKYYSGDAEPTFSNTLTYPSTTLLSVTFNVDMTDSIASGYFVEGTDQLWLGTNINSWTTPGTDAAFELFESATNDIYTMNTQLVNGDYAYKYFKIVGGVSTWDNGEWTGDPNRVFTVAGEDVVLNDVFGVKPIGINDLAKGISVYPNPSNGQFNIKVDQTVNMQVFDITGKIINSQIVNGSSSLQLNNTGVYFLKFSNSEGSTTLRVIVK